jgi:peptidoglycan/LPS O-acetylase OafA/YrhL
MPGTSTAVAPPKVFETPATRIPELDGVRGLAIGLVLIYHYVHVISPGKNLLYYAFLPIHLMWSGVDLFFVLSGLLIGGILLDHRESRRYYSVFYARRVHRIFPIYYLMIAGLVLGTWAFPHSPLFLGSMPLWVFPIYGQNLTGDFTRAPAWIGVSWSLAVEEQFYLLFPLIVRLVSRTTLLRLMGACIFCAPVLRTVLIMRGWSFEQVYPLLPCRADALALGVVAAIIVRSEHGKSWVRENSKRLYCCLLALVAVLPTILKWATYQYVGTIGYSILDVMYFLLILLLLVAPVPLMKAVFNAPWMRWLGTVSYCAYLVHQPVLLGMFLLFRLGTNTRIDGLTTLAVTLAALVMTLAVAQGSWLVLERRLIKRAHLRYQYEPVACHGVPS